MNMFDSFRADAKQIAEAQLRVHEGLRLKPYHDTVGVLTIGYGRNLTNGISNSEAELMLRNDLDLAFEDAKKFSAVAWNQMNDARKAVVINMAFNLGYARLSKFVLFRAALAIGDWEKAARRMESSLWYKQVKGRAVELTKQMRDGVIK
jgi:lysozyme